MTLTALAEQLAKLLGQVARLADRVTKLERRVASPWLTTAEAAQRVGMSVRSVHYARDTGLLRAFTPPTGNPDANGSHRTWRYHVRDVDAWITESPLPPLAELGSPPPSRTPLAHRPH